jgi:predicted metalloendopeptidase
MAGCNDELLRKRHWSAFVKRYFPEQRHAAAAKLVREVIGSFDDVIEKQDWLDE